MAKNGHDCDLDPACIGGCRLLADGQGTAGNSGTAAAAASASGKR